MIKIGIIGRPSSGKSTFFSAATCIDVPIAAYPFTTIKPNIGMGYVSTDCMCKQLNVKCNPRNSACVDGKRLIPIQLIDVAGLVPDAHLGKGLGNEFLSDLMGAEAFIHVVDLSGLTNAIGEPATDYDPREDIIFLEKEIDYWIKGLLEKNWKSIEQKSKQGTELYKLIYKELSGLGIEEEKVKKVIKEGYTDLLDLAHKVRIINKPMTLIGNKYDLKESQQNFEKLKKDFDIIPASADYELFIKKARGKTLNEKQQQAMKVIESYLGKFKTTGVQDALNKIVFEKLNYLVVYPVEDEKNFSDSQGKVLPDALIVKKGTTALELAFKIHQEIGDKFKGAVNVRSRKQVGKDYELQNNDVIKINTT